MLVEFLEVNIVCLHARVAIIPVEVEFGYDLFVWHYQLIRIRIDHFMHAQLFIIKIKVEAVLLGPDALIF